MLWLEDAWFLRHIPELWVFRSFYVPTKLQKGLAQGRRRVSLRCRCYMKWYCCLTESQPCMQLDSSFHSLTTVFNSQQEKKNKTQQGQSKQSLQVCTKKGGGGHLVELRHIYLANMGTRLQFHIKQRKNLHKMRNKTRMISKQRWGRTEEIS